MSDKPQVWIVTPQKRLALPEGKVEDINKLHDAFDDHFSQPICDLARWKELPWDVWLFASGGSGIYQARNVAATNFVQETKNDNDTILFHDYDLLASAQDYVNILCHDLSIVGGLYTTREDNGHWVMNRLAGARPSERGILPVMELGTGFKAFKRRVFTKALKDNPWLDCESDANHRKRFYSFFSMGPVWDKKLWPGRGRGLTEDYWFDWITRESGFTTCVDTTVKLRHYDDFTKKTFPAVFPPDPGKLPPEAREP